MSQVSQYESEHTRFMRAWFEKHPEENAVIQSGRAMWWDKPPLDEKTRRRLRAAESPRPAYYYFAMK